MPNPTSFLNQLRYCVAKIEGDSFTIVYLTSMPTAASPKTRQRFDYTDLDIATSQFVRRQTGEIRVLMKRTVESIFEVGQRLIAVKSRLGHGRFGLWLVAEFEWSQDTANNFINVAKRLGQNPKFSDFDMAASALYVLFAPSTPEAAREEAITRAKAGESISYTTAKAIKQKYASSPKKHKPEAQQPEQFSQPIPQSLPTPSPLPQSDSKLEIVAFRPQTRTPAISEAARVIANQVGVTPSAPRADQTGSNPNAPGVWWQLGGKHLLYCGDPNSPEFVRQITERVSLLLAFPPIPDWQTVIRAKARIIVDEYLPQGKKLEQLDENIESNVLFHSNLGDLVVSCFLPSPEILSVVSRHSRRGLFAEPDSRRVAVVISNWKEAGLKAERVNQR